MIIDMTQVQKHIGNSPLWLTLLLALGAGLLHAQHPPQADIPTPPNYRWTILLDCRPHPALSPGVRSQLRRDILAALQPLLSPLGTVEVLDLATLATEHWPPLALDYAQRGWAALDANHLRELEDRKLQILRIEVRGESFHLQTRLWDGFTGLPLPLHHRQTDDPNWLGRMAGLMLEEDFTLNGTIEQVESSGEEATVQLRRPAGVDAGEWVQRGDVFAVAGVRKSARPSTPTPKRTATGKVIEEASEPPPRFTSVTREFTLLRAVEAPKDGRLRCKVFSGYSSALPMGGGVVGYRCVKLPVRSAPLLLKLAGGEANTLTTALRVQANDVGWAAPGLDMTFQDGLFRSPRPLDRLAFVTVQSGPSRSARVPVAVLGRGPVALPFSRDASEERRAAFERDCADLARRVAEARFAQVTLFDGVARLITAQRNAEALARASAGLLASDADDKELSAALKRLRDLLALAPGQGLVLDACERQLADIRTAQAELAARVRDLQTRLEAETSSPEIARQTQAEVLTARIKFLLERGDVEEALTVYEQLLTLLPNNSSLLAQRDRLREQAKAKSDTHAQAQDYLARVWPSLATIAELKDGLPALQAAVEECLRQQDRYALRRLVMNFSLLPIKIHDLAQSLDANKEEDRQLLQDARAVLEAAARVEGKIRPFLQGQSEAR